MKFKVWDEFKQEFSKSISRFFVDCENVLWFLTSQGLTKAGKDFLPVYSTGATGKNEVELFGGDIVKASIYEGEDEQILEVKCVNGVFIIEYDDGDFESFLIVDFPGIIEKIGSKFENPDLLK